MLLATIALLTPAIARFRYFMPGGPPLAIGGTSLLVAACMAYDRAAHGRVHPAFLWGGLFLMLSLPFRFAIGAGDLAVDREMADPMMRSCLPQSSLAPHARGDAGARRKPPHTIHAAPDLPAIHLPIRPTGERIHMTHEARFFSGDVMAQHWSDEDGGVAVMAAKKKAAKKAQEGDQEAEAEADPPRAGCGTGKKTC